jgi:SprT protein
MTIEKAQTLFQQHVPPAAVFYCLELYEQYQFRFTLRKNRVTKVGDFTFRTGHIPRITVNNDLHPYLFLITYIHEVAHLHVHLHHSNRVEAHGSEWKKSFQQLLDPVLTEEVFPDQLLRALRKHMINPKATSYSDPALTQVLRQYDPKAVKQTLLSELPEGSTFSLNNRWFIKGSLRRTRYLCKELKSKRTYLVPADVPIESAQLSLL